VVDVVALCPLRKRYVVKSTADGECVVEQEFMGCVHERCAWYSVIYDACYVRQLLRLPASIEALREAVRA
jgi:hypothetical protein